MNEIEKMEKAIQEFYDNAFHSHLKPVISYESICIAFKALIDKVKTAHVMPLTLKDLENRINKPVYVVDNIDKWFTGWYLVRDVDDKNVGL